MASGGFMGLMGPVVVGAGYMGERCHGCGSKHGWSIALWMVGTIETCLICGYAVVVGEMALPAFVDGGGAWR